MEFKGEFSVGILASIHHEEYFNGNIAKNEKVISKKVQDLSEMTKKLGIFFSAPSAFADFSETLD